MGNRRYQRLVIFLMIVAIIVAIIFGLVPLLRTCNNNGDRPIIIINVIPGEGGTIVISPLPDDDGRYEPGTKVTIEARPAPGFRFVRWSGDADGTMPITVVTMDKDKRVIAEFE